MSTDIAQCWSYRALVLRQPPLEVRTQFLGRISCSDQRQSYAVSLPGVDELAFPQENAESLGVAIPATKSDHPGHRHTTPPLWSLQEAICEFGIEPRCG